MDAGTRKKVASGKDAGPSRRLGLSPREPAKEVGLVEAVLERFASVDKDHRDFFVIAALELGVGVNIHLAPGEGAGSRQTGELLLYDVAEMASDAGVDEDFGEHW